MFVVFIVVKPALGAKDCFDFDKRIASSTLEVGMFSFSGELDCIGASTFSSIDSSFFAQNEKFSAGSS